MDIEKITLCVIKYYIEYNPEYMDGSFFIDKNGIPKGLSHVKIYQFSDRDDLIVVAGDKTATEYWQMYYMFTYKNNALSLFPDMTLFKENYSAAEEIRLIYDEGFPFTIVEVFSYSHQGNGGFYICRLKGNSLEYITGGTVMGRHYTTWEDKREDPIFNEIGLEKIEYYDCRYEGGHLTPYYEDINKDGYIDIILSGKFQCEDMNGNILLSQEVKRVFLYNALHEKYIFNISTGIRSPLEEYWLPNMFEWIESQNVN